MIQSILVALDGSEAAESVLPYAQTIARAMRAHLILLAAVHEGEGWRDGDDANRGAQAYLDSIRERIAPTIEAPIEARVVDAQPAQAILDAAHEASVGLIAMTMHGRTGLKEWLLGGTATKVIHASRRPVLVVRPADGDSEQQSPGLETVLVPLDVSELSSSALPFAEDLAKALDASIVVMHAVEPPLVTYPAPEPVVVPQTVLDEIEASAHAFVRSVADELSAKGLRTKPLVLVGSAAEAILEAAEAERAGLVVMSTHGRSGVERLLLGSVAEAVVRLSGAPVALVPPPHD